jgi:PAN domain
MNSEYDNAVRAIQFIGEAKGYPSRAERIKQIGGGWKDATGKGIPSDEPQPPAKAGPTPQVVLQPPTNSLNKFTQKDNRDIFGNDILLTEGRPGIPGITLNECALACDKRKSCVAFSFDKWKAWCFLKNKISTSLLDPHSTIAVKKPLKLPNASKAEPELIVLKGRRFRDKPINQSKAANAEACQKICEDSLKCVAYSYLKKEKSENCFLFNGSAGHYSDSAADSGYKRQAPPS